MEDLSFHTFIHWKLVTRVMVGRDGAFSLLSQKGLVLFLIKENQWMDGATSADMCL